MNWTKSFVALACISAGLIVSSGAVAAAPIDISKFSDKSVHFEKCIKRGSQVDCTFWVTAKSQSNYLLEPRDGLMMDDGSLVRAVSYKVGGEIVPAFTRGFKRVHLVAGVRTKIVYTMADVPDDGIITKMVIFATSRYETAVAAFPSN